MVDLHHAPRFCNLGESFVAAFPSCFWGVQGSGHSVFLITAFRSTAIVKLIFEILGIPSLKVEIVSFQMVIIVRKLTILRGFYRKTKIISCLNSWTPCKQSKLDSKMSTCYIYIFQSSRWKFHKILCSIICNWAFFNFELEYWMR